MFDAAKAASPAADKKKTKSDRVEFEVEGLKESAGLRALIKNLTTIADSLDAEVKDECFDRFVDIAVKHGRQPESFDAVEGDASAVVSLKKRSSASALSEEVVEQLRKAGISTEKAVATPEAYIINPVYAKNSALLQKVSEALKEVDGLPEDFITFQAEVSKDVTTANSIAEVCETKNEQLIRELLPLVSTIAVKPNATEVDLGDAIRTIRNLTA